MTDPTYPPDYDPNDYVFVSKRHYNRKQNIINKQNSNITSIIGRPGPIAGIIVYLFDAFINLLARLLVYLLRITNYGYSIFDNYIWGNFDGVLPNTIIGGKVLSYRYMRYIMTVLLPPVGVFMGKGLYGFFNIFVCLIITYINYIAGIVYAIVITMNNRYADQYEEKQYKELKERNPDVILPDMDSTAFIGMIVFISLVILAILVFLYYF